MWVPEYKPENIDEVVIADLLFLYGNIIMGTEDASAHWFAYWNATVEDGRGETLLAASKAITEATTNAH